MSRRKPRRVAALTTINYSETIVSERSLNNGVGYIVREPLLTIELDTRGPRARTGCRGANFIPGSTPRVPAG